MLLFCFQIIILAKVIIDVDHITLSARGVTILVESLYSVNSTTIILTGKKELEVGYIKLHLHETVFKKIFCNLNNKQSNTLDTMSHGLKNELVYVYVQLHTNSTWDSGSLLCTPTEARQLWPWPFWFPSYLFNPLIIFCKYKMRIQLWATNQKIYTLIYNSNGRFICYSSGWFSFDQLHILLTFKNSLCCYAI